MMVAERTNVYFDTLQHEEWTFHLAATDKGLCCITLPNETLETLQAWVIKHASRARVVRDKDKLRPYVLQVKEYLQGSRTEYSLPLDLRGTPFQVKVWHALLDVEYGKTLSYSEIGKKIGHPTAVRAVGAANGANPVPIVVPCHRVIGKSGQLTGYRGSVGMKARLLRLEGALS